MSKILNISIWIITLSVIVSILGFVNVSKKQLTFVKPQVSIDYDTENRFIDEGDIIHQVLNKNDTGTLLLTNFKKV